MCRKSRKILFYWQYVKELLSNQKSVPLNRNNLTFRLDVHNNFDNLVIICWCIN